jgi:hypothetical protein
MTTEQLLEKYVFLKPLLAEAAAFRVVNIKTGAKCRTFDEARANDATLYRPDTDYCAVQLWKGVLQKRGDIPMTVLIDKNVAAEDREFATQVIKANLRKCQHEVVDIYYHVDGNGNTTDEVCTDEDCPQSHHCVPVKDHTYAFEVPPPTTAPGWYSLDRNLNLCWVCGKEHPAGFGSLLQMLKHANDPEKHPAPEILGKDGWHTSDGELINDLKEPLFVVRSCDEGHALADRLELAKRWNQGKLSRWYVENCFYVVDAPTREALLDMNLTKATVTGALSWKPVVLTFADAEVERKLAQVCTQVVTVLPVEGRDYLADVRAAVVDIKEAAVITSDDMPLECLDGWLGEVCRSRMLKDYPAAYAWPALLTAASVLVNKELLPQGTRANVFTGLIGPVGSGKTCVFNEAFRLLNLKDNPRAAEVADTEVVRLKSGSGEGMAQKIGDQNGASKLVFVDELEHLMKKINIKGSTFANTLDDVYTTDSNRVTVEHRKEILFDVRLTLAGGVPEEGFSETFGAGTVTGLHSRFMFGVCPNDYPGYCWAPPQGSPALERSSSEPTADDSMPFSTSTRPTAVTIDDAVWEETRRWQRELKIHGRAVEIGIKAAVIAAAFDNRETLTAAQLGPALAFPKYQDALHRRFLPNPGKNDDACFEHDVTQYLQDRAAHGEPTGRREMLQFINAYRYGSGVINRVLSSMSQNRVIELGNAGRKLTVRLCLDKK